MLADRAYSSKAIRAYLPRRGIRAVIPEPADSRPTANDAAGAEADRATWTVTPTGNATRSNAA
ncbi:hypothetical protein GCM10023205_79590 [Yinghuangia aomiensis]|uniref:Transposase DDE domain-containing protein n=1 Tax=Yinghuangia aomiensis TaxID=676205 RepID=A0ABP9IE39_9ACTN